MAEVTETNIQTDVPAENQSVERCLTFESGDMTLFLSINNVTEIINDCAITHLPLVPDYIKRNHQSAWSDPSGSRYTALYGQACFGNITVRPALSF